ISPGPAPESASAWSEVLTVELRVQGINPVSQILEPTVGMYVESSQDLHSVVVRVLRAEITGDTLDVLTDHDDGQQYKLKESLRDPGDDAFAAGLECWWQSNQSDARKQIGTPH